MDKGIHMMIQPGSDVFWKKYFNSRFDGKRITLFGGETLNTNLADGKVFEISKESLVANYKFPQDRHLRDRDMEKSALSSLIERMIYKIKIYWIKQIIHDKQYFKI